MEPNDLAVHALGSAAGAIANRCMHIGHRMVSIDHTATSGTNGKCFSGTRILTWTLTTGLK